MIELQQRGPWSMKGRNLGRSASQTPVAKRDKMQWGQTDYFGYFACSGRPEKEIAGWSGAIFT
ncbi:hypothetical protein [Cupriavidus pauculus]|uniref:hypothetical protein n=1 Tax=Cupriavidus pauculus TaxID=82633 RepID=UPI0038577795